MRASDGRASGPDAIAFGVRVGYSAEAAEQHPDHDVRWRTVHVIHSTHDAGGITGKDFAVRPLVARGFSTEGAVIEDTNTVPEIAVTADGVHWHPAGAHLETSPDMLLARHASPDQYVALAEAKRLAVERFLVLRRNDGSLPLVYNCAV